MITIYYTYYEPTLQKEKRSREHQLGRSLLSMGLWDLYGLSIPPDQIDRHLSANDHEKPYLPQHPHIHFNISHCEQLVACGFSPCPLGIDVEDIAPFRETIFRRVLTPSEQEFLLPLRENLPLYQEYFYRFWTLKESRIKEAGLGLAMPMTDFSFQINASTDPAQITCSQENLHFYQTKLDTRRILSVCTRQPIESIALRLIP
ncbi:MAG: 4'-phosphopantetheinyl transferase superfamily protein [Lachnospiraceae bacterium]|nr:4'-phosphopantetheinyl transferase superfamily protein [Lachnospiraceae bacterium]